MPRPTKQQLLEAQASSITPGKFPGIEKCALRTSLNVISGKWKLLVLANILEGPRRYGELRRLVPEATEKMVIQVLRELEQDAIIARKSYAEVPPRVEYSVTEQGRLLKPVLAALLHWEEGYRDWKTGPTKAT